MVWLLYYLLRPRCPGFKHCFQNRTGWGTENRPVESVGSTRQVESVFSIKNSRTGSTSGPILKSLDLSGQKVMFIFRDLLLSDTLIRHIQTWVSFKWKFKKKKKLSICLGRPTFTLKFK